tara:strand:- start:367 stop:471 length:105 start_codon:yes stop_codon:yes gene_type:complete
MVFALWVKTQSAIKMTARSAGKGMAPGAYAGRLR